MRRPMRLRRYGLRPRWRSSSVTAPPRMATRPAPATVIQSAAGPASSLPVRGRTRGCTAPAGVFVGVTTTPPGAPPGVLVGVGDGVTGVLVGVAVRGRTVFVGVGVAVGVFVGVFVGV